MGKLEPSLETSGQPLVFLGSGPVAAASLRHLASVFPIEAVITKPVTKEEMTRAAPGAPILTVQNKAELTKLIQNQRFKARLGVIVDFGIIVEAAVIEAFPLGIVNSHFSLLPQWRGADPITFAILSGQPKTGVSLMLIEPTLDTGKLLAQKSLPITDDDTTPSLTDKLISLSNQLLQDYIPRYLSGQVRPRSQPHPSRASYSRKLIKEDGRLDWSKPAAQLEREIRAFADWPKSYTSLAGKDVIITKAHTSNQEPELKPGQLSTDNKQLAIGTSSGLLVIDQLKPAGKPQMTAAAFLAGYKQLLY